MRRPDTIIAQSPIQNQPSVKQCSMPGGRRPRFAHIICGCRAGIDSLIGLYAIPSFPALPPLWRHRRLTPNACMAAGHRGHWLQHRFERPA